MPIQFRGLAWPRSRADLSHCLPLLLALAGCGGRAASVSEATAGGAFAAAAGAAPSSAGGSGGSLDATPGGAETGENDGGAATTPGGASNESPDAGSAGALQNGCGTEVPIEPSSAVAPTSIAPRQLSELVTDARWDSAATVGMAVSASGRLYLGTAYEIDTVDGAVVSNYLSATDAATTAGLFANTFIAFDLDPLGSVYAVLSGALIRSSKPHVAVTWRNNPAPVAAQLAVIAEDDLLVVGTQSIWHVTATCERQLFSHGELIGLDCGQAQIAAATSGVFAFQPDCGVQQLYVGRSDGSSFGEVYPDAASGLLAGASFSCTTRDPAGGFYGVATVNQSWQLLHFAESARGMHGLSFVSSSPSLDAASDVQRGKGQHVDLSRCRLAAQRDGTLFLQSAATVWKLSPPP